MKPRKIPARLVIEGENGGNSAVPVRLEYKEDSSGWRGTIQTLHPVLSESATHQVRLGDYRVGTIQLHDVARNGKTARFTGAGVPLRATKPAMS